MWVEGERERDRINEAPLWTDRTQLWDEAKEVVHNIVKKQREIIETDEGHIID